MNHQLLLSSNNLWSPGQVFEKIFGIDSAILATEISFWRLFGYTTIPTGTVLGNYRWNWLWRTITRSVRKFPSFKVNLLIQAKRPSYRYGINADYAKLGIKKDYWQFKLTLHQQKILEHLERKLGSNAFVVYACGAFHKFSDLDNYISSGQLAANSTFVKPSKLNGHSKWVYDRPGTVGLACSKIEKQYDEDFLTQLERLFSIVSNDKEASKDEALKNLLELEKISIEICNELQEKNPIAKAFIARQKQMTVALDDYTSPNQLREPQFNIQAVRCFLSFDIFTSTLNLSWTTI